MQIPLIRCRKILAMLWLSGTVVLSFIIFFQTIFNHYGEKAIDAWGWFLPNIAPTFSLIMGVWAVDARNEEIERQTVDQFMFRLTMILSAVYLTVMALAIFLQPFSVKTPFEMMKEANIPLGLFQGSVSASIGVFFAKRKTS